MYQLQLNYANNDLSNEHISPENDIKNLDKIFYDVHCLMRDIDGHHESDALDEICKILFLIVFLSLKNDKRLYEQISSAKSYKEKAQILKSIYHAASNEEMEKRGVTNKENKPNFWTDFKLKDATIVKSFEMLCAYDFVNMSLDIKGRVFQNFVSPVLRSHMGQYFTPEPVAQMMITVLNPSVGEKSLDPFAGSAHMLSLIADKSCKTVKQGNKTVFGIEKNERMLRIAWADLLFHGLYNIHIEYGDSLVDIQLLKDFGFNSFDVVATNPPFGSLMLNEGFENYESKYEMLNRGRFTPLEILAFERVVNFLKPGGRLAIVVPDGLLTNDKTLDLRRWLGEKIKLRAIISLPIETFAPFGANVKTSVVFASKMKQVGEGNDVNVFLGCIENVGYDAAGRYREGSEISNMIDSVQKFLQVEGW